MSAGSGPRPAGGAGRWIGLILLTGTALLGGYALVSPLCYWQGRLYSRGVKIPLSAYSPALTSQMWDLLAVAVSWLVLWFLYARIQGRRPRGWAFAAVPLVAFVAAALHASSMAYACNPM